MEDERDFQSTLDPLLPSQFSQRPKDHLISCFTRDQRKLPLQPTKRSPPRPSLSLLSLLSSLELSDTKVYQPSVRAFLGTAAHFCEVVVPLSSECGTHKTGKTRNWHIYDSQGQNLAHTRQSRPESSTYETVKARLWHT